MAARAEGTAPLRAVSAFPGNRTTDGAVAAGMLSSKQTDRSKPSRPPWDALRPSGWPRLQLQWHRRHGSGLARRCALRCSGRSAIPWQRPGGLASVRPQSTQWTDGLPSSAASTFDQCAAVSTVIFSQLCLLLALSSTAANTCTTTVDPAFVAATRQAPHAQQGRSPAPPAPAAQLSHRHWPSPRRQVRTAR